METKNLMDSPSSKPLEYWPLEQYLQPEQQSLLVKLLNPQNELQHEIKSTPIFQQSNPTFLTADDFQQQSRDSKLCGKSQNCTQCLKTGTAPIYKGNQTQIPGITILSISVLKAPLCPHRYLRICPLLYFHLVQMEKKEE